MRLLNTIVTYDGDPFFVIAITNHKPDGIFRMYLDPIPVSGKMNIQMVGDARPPYDQYEKMSPELGVAMDGWLKTHPDSGIQRKMMNSPKFNRFRPFQMGMYNAKGSTTYLARHPTRNVEQGFTKKALMVKPVSLHPEIGGQVDIYSPAFRACVRADFPHPKECLERMIDPEISNKAVGFHRDFALLRGPLDTLFLSYRGETIGFLPDNDFKTVRLGRDFQHTREACGDLSLFDKIVIS